MRLANKSGLIGDVNVIESFLDIQISRGQYQAIKAFLYSETGIDLGDHKQSLVTGRLCKRLRHYQLRSYADYYDLVLDVENQDERQHMLDLLTTNETYFFREQAHFDYLTSQILPAHPPSQNFRIWSAASSSGEEAYSMAMELAWHLGRSPWEVMGSDINTEVIEKARLAMYDMERTEGIPDKYLKRFCYKGKGQYAGNLLIDPRLAERVRFEMINLTQSNSLTEQFDVVFLRNVIIYFDPPTKIKVLKHVASALKKGGHLMIGHSESLNNLKLEGILQYIAPTIYQKV